MPQSAFFAVKATLPFDSSIRLVEASDFDRTVILTRMSDTVLIGFTSFDPTVAQEFAQVAPLDEHQQMEFVLPAGHEFWAGHTQDGLTVTLSLLVTKR